MSDGDFDKRREIFLEALGVFLRSCGVQLEADDEYDGHDNYCGTRYAFTVADDRPDGERTPDGRRELLELTEELARMVSR